MAGKSMAVKQPETKMYRILIPRDPKLKNEALFVAINGRSYAVPRGVEVTVPQEVYEVIKNSEAQDNHTQEMIAQLIENSQS